MIRMTPPEPPWKTRYAMPARPETPLHLDLPGLSGYQVWTVQAVRGVKGFVLTPDPQLGGGSLTIAQKRVSKATRTEAPASSAPSPRFASKNVSIRAYQTGDKPALRRICFKTGCMGEPADRWMDLNEEFFTDLWLDYYLTHEPEHALVAEVNGTVVGYLTACTDSRRRERYLWARFWPRALWRLITRRYRLGPRALKVAGRALHDWVRHGFPRIPPGYSGHVHYNVDSGFRRMQFRCGIRLLGHAAQMFLNKNVDGCHGVIVVPRPQAERRYHHLAEIVDVRPTTLFRNCDPRELCLATVVARSDLAHMPRYWKRLLLRQPRLSKKAKG